MSSFSERHVHPLPPEVNPERRTDVPFALRELVEKSARRWNVPRTALRELTWNFTKVDIGCDEKHQWAAFACALLDAAWYQVYDVIEALHQAITEEDQSDEEPEELDDPYPKAPRFERDINEYLIRAGIPWQLVDGEIVTRGDEAFEHTVGVAIVEEELAGRPTTQRRLREAISDLSRRPEADLTGAISHAIGALESVIGDVEYTVEEARENKNHTFGAFLRKHPALFPSDDVKNAFKHVWLYACNEGSRHAKEGIEPKRDEAELIVGLAAALVTYINRKNPK